jgi:pimeloyl-ACP methyl ester carboxylesterase
MSAAAQPGIIRAAGIHFLERPGAADRTVILLHGIGGRAAGFADVMALWPEGPRVLAWDCPGFGLSRALPMPAPSPADYAAVLSEALLELGCKTFDLMGQSLGALFAGAFTSIYPESVRRLVLMCPALGYRTAAGAPLLEGLQKRLSDHTAEGPEAFAAARASRLVHGPDRKPEVVRRVRDSMAGIAAEGHAQAVHALAQGDLLSGAAAWKQPVMLIAGADDVITPFAGTEALFSVLRSRFREAGVHEHLHVVGDAGHAVFLEQPATVAAVAAGFLGFSP